MNGTSSDIYLASSSPRRAELLMQIEVGFEVVRFAIDETPASDESPKEYVARMALEKAREGYRLTQGSDDLKLPVLAADTIVVCDGKIFGKPESQEHAYEMLRSLSAKTHQVMSAVTLIFGDDVQSILSSTNVSFRDIDDLEIQAYWQSEEPKGKAGGYAIQGLGAVFVSQIEGSYSGVVGLPLNEVSALLSSVGIHCL